MIPKRDQRREKRYLSGNTVYGSGRNSPHQGTRLDPTGYIERELKKRRVQKRSRLAQGALGRLAQNNQNVTSGTSPGTMPGQVGNWTQGSGANPNNTGPSTGGPNTTPSTDPNADPNADPQQGGGFQPPMATLNGKLVPMPWDLQMQWLDNTNQWAQQNAGWDNQINQSQIDLGQYLRDMSKQHVRDNSALANNEAARGMSFSSGNAYGIQDIANNYATWESDAQNQMQALLGQIGVGGSQRAMGQAAYDQTQAMIQAEAARILAEQAGTLGLGNQPTPTNTGLKGTGLKGTGINKKGQRTTNKPAGTLPHKGVTIGDRNPKPRNKKRKRKGK